MTKHVVHTITISIPPSHTTHYVSLDHKERKQHWLADLVRPNTPNGPEVQFHRVCRDRSPFFGRGQYVKRIPVSELTEQGVEPEFVRYVQALLEDS